MGLVLEVFPSDETLDELQETVQQKERGGFELLTLARGKVGGQQGNLASFLRRAPGDVPAPVTLARVDGASTRAQQEEAVNAGETGVKRLISYAGVFLSGQETNVAVYRA